MALTVRERTTTFLQFLVRLAGIVGGILGVLSPFAPLEPHRLTAAPSAAVCSDFGFRTASFMLERLVDAKQGPRTPLPGFVASPAPPKTPTAVFTSAFGMDR